MEFLTRIFSIFDKADRAIRHADRMQGTVDRLSYQTGRFSSTGKLKKLIYILILVLVILYFVLG